MDVGLLGCLTAGCWTELSLHSMLDLVVPQLGVGLGCLTTCCRTSGLYYCWSGLFRLWVLDLVFPQLGVGLGCFTTGFWTGLFYLWAGYFHHWALD